MEYRRYPCDGQFDRDGNLVQGHCAREKRNKDAYDMQTLDYRRAILKGHEQCLLYHPEHMPGMCAACPTLEIGPDLLAQTSSEDI